MTSGEIISIMAVCISLLGVIVALIFSIRKDKREDTNEVKEDAATLATIQNELRNISANTERIERKVDKIEERSNGDHEKIVEHETKIKNLEKEVFKKRSA